MASDRNEFEETNATGVRVEDVVALLRSGGRIDGSPSTATKAVLELARPRTCLVGLLAFALALTLSGVDWSWKASIVGAIVFLIAAIGNIDNATTDLEEDAINLPGRINTVAILGVSKVNRIVRQLEILCIAASAIIGPFQLLLGLVAVLGLGIYSRPPVRAKGRPFLGIVVFSGVVAIPFLMGALLPSGTSSWLDPLRSPASGWGQEMVAFLFVGTLFAAKGVFKNVPDYDGDRDAGVRTSATVWRSPKRAAYFSCGTTVIGYGLLAVPIASGAFPPRAALAWSWVPFALYDNAVLCRPVDAVRKNAALRRDMSVSVAFFVTLLLAVGYSETNVLVASVCVVILLGSDALSFDSRRAKDTR